MKRQITYTATKQRNFGFLTEVSKEINYSLGDYTDRTVSMRTAHGYKRAFNRHDIDDNTAEDIVHLIMTAAPILVSQKNDGAKAVGILVFAALFGLYQQGR